MENAYIKSKNVKSAQVSRNIKNIYSESKYEIYAIKSKYEKYIK